MIELRRTGGRQRPWFARGATTVYAVLAPLYQSSKSEQEQTIKSVASDIAFTAAVKAVQSAKGSRRSYERMERGNGWNTVISPEPREFIARLDMFYLGTASADGQPYIQYRGGPAGFLRVLDDNTLAFADFSGNQQYITLGNLSENPRVFVFLMDYATATRIKIWGTARVVENDPELIRSLSDPGYPGTPQRAVIIKVEAWDGNCRQHIHRRYRATPTWRHRSQFSLDVRRRSAMIHSSRKPPANRPWRQRFFREDARRRFGGGSSVC